MDGDGNDISTKGHFHSKNMILTHSVQMETQIAEAYQQMYVAEDSFVRQGSAWNLEKIEDYNIECGRISSTDGI